ncbi:hypothetical protein AGMMS49944_26650 [Spirochaetia bacterium]|nr:hypothetical protein AGMMS49944_26650 [Spirochaetia bacterium]
MKKVELAVFVMIAVLVCFGCKTAPEVITTDTYYVSASGNDANNGLTAKTPFKTLKKALDTAKGEGAYKIITVLGVLNAASEGVGEGSSVFAARTTGVAVITIKGGDAAAALSALDAGKRVIEIVGNAYIRLENIEVSGGAITDPDIAKGGGGGILVAASTTNGATLIAGKGAVIKSNRAQVGGGVVVIGTGSSFTLDGGEVRENSSATDGGGILAAGSTLTITAGTVDSNTAAVQGGGVSVYTGAALTFVGGEITGNQAEDGGGLHIIGNAVMQGGSISRNSSPSNGGGVSVKTGGNFTLTGGDIRDNTALTAGGGVSVFEGTFVMQNGLIANNTAISATASEGAFKENGTGGGVFVIQGSFELSGGAITGNTANNSGGGVNANQGSTFTMSGGEIGGNSAVFGGGGVAVLGANARFKKTGGIIYGFDAPAEQRNTTTQDGNSVDVSRNSDLRQAVITDIKRRKNTAATDLDSTKNGADGGWDIR